MASETAAPEEASAVAARPLNSPWSIWEHRENTGGGWDANMFKLCDFESVGEFWGYWNSIPKPSEIFFDGNSNKRFVDRKVSSFSIFKKGIKPEWEDEGNKRGGEWFCRKRMDPAALDELWLHLVLGMIGETIDAGDEITGVRVVDKSKRDIIYRIELWFRNGSKDAAPAYHELRDRMQACLEAGSGRGVPQFQFRPHF
jgi:hypothetical protein